MASSSKAATMYMYGGLSEDNNATLHTLGHQLLNSYLSLQTTGMQDTNNDADLFVDGLGLFSKIGLLYILGSKDIVNTHTSLVIQVDNGTHSDVATLYIPNTQTELELTKGRTLFIEGRLHQDSEYAPLFVMNEGSSNLTPLFIKTPSGFKNAVPDSRTATLFINRPNEAVVMPLFLKAIDNTTNTFATLYIESVIEDTSNITLVIPNVTSIPVNTYSPLFVEGMIVDTGNTSLFIDAFGILTNTTPLFIKQETQDVNTYSTLYIRGIEDILTNNITLVIPGVFDEDTSSSAPFYVFGW